MQQLLYPVFLPRTVDIGDLVLWKATEELVNLLRLKARGYPGILL